jgi:hypothetical protein
MILTRYVRASMSRGIGSLCITAAVLYGGIAAYKDYVCPYRMDSHRGQWYLVDKKSEARKEITKGFELGTLDERILGILKESKQEVVKSLERYTR